MTQEEENHCIRSVLNGNLNDFEKLITFNKESAFSIAESIVKDASDAKDVLQESYVNAFNYLHTFSGESRFGTWLYRIVVNQSLKLIRKRKRIIEFQKGNYESNNIVATNLGLDNLEKREKKQRIQEVLKHLKPKESLMLNLFYLQEFSIQEIHTSTGFSISNIKVLLHRARSSFANYYAIKKNY